MKTYLFAIALVPILVTAALDATADEINYSLDSDVKYGNKGDSCDCGICNSCFGDCRRFAFFVDAEINFMRFNEANGVGGGGNFQKEFNHEITPRISVGMMGPQGLGLRARYWHFSHDAISASPNKRMP